jgi:hypothetical protein
MGDATRTAGNTYIKLITSFTGNFTAFHAYMDDFRAEGMHGATHMVSRCEVHPHESEGEAQRGGKV